MSLNFLSPWMLLGVLLVAGPLLAHLTGQREGPRILFPTVRFLKQAADRIRRRTRLENLLLLLLRVLAVLLLVLLFSRPRFSWQGVTVAGVDPESDTLLLVDRSLSMNRRVGKGGETLGDLARIRALEVLDGLSPGARAAVLFWDGSTVVVPPGLTHDRRPLLQAIRDGKPGYGTSALGAALLRGADLVRDAGSPRATMLVLSDGTATSLPEAGRSPWPENLAVRYLDLSQEEPSNQWVSSVVSQPGQARGEAARVEVQVAAVGKAMRREASMALELEDLDPLRATADLREASRVSRRFTLTHSAEGRRGGKVVLDPEDGVLPQDDSRCFLLEGSSSLTVHMVSGDSGGSPRNDELFYVESALLPRPGSSSRIAPQVVSLGEVGTWKGGEGRVLVLANVADPSPHASSLRSFVQEGGGLLISVGSRVQSQAWNQSLSDLLPGILAGVKDLGERTFEQSPLTLARPAMDSPVFNVFREGGSPVFGRVRFGKVFAVEPQLPEGAEVMLRYSDGRPALLSREVGKGRVILFTSTLDDDWTDFPLHGVFVPTLHQLARLLSGSLSEQAPQSILVGEEAKISGRGKERASVRTPDDREIPLPRSGEEGDLSIPFKETEVPGIYRVFLEREGAEPRLVEEFCVNASEEESSLRPVTSGELTSRIPGLEWMDRGREGTPAREERRVMKSASLTPHALGVLALLLLVEGIFIARRAPR